ncbi:MAG: hypothetical protein MZV63_56120 [Marinilabiliales bacterium]|nr:hypothetical protein [Marinilabiliales bacterium]
MVMAGERNLQQLLGTRIDPLVVHPSFYFVDINTLTSNVLLKTGVMNGFKLDQASLPGNWLDYWDGKGVPRPGSTRNLAARHVADHQRRRTDLLYPLRRL